MGAIEALISMLGRSEFEMVTVDMGDDRSGTVPRKRLIKILKLGLEAEDKAEGA